MAIAPRPDLKAFVRVVALPFDPIGVHLVVEVVRAEFDTPGAPPDYRAPTTVCRQVGYETTTRRTSACPECDRGMNEAIWDARMAATAKLAIAERARSTNGHAHP